MRRALAPVLLALALGGCDDGGAAAPAARPGASPRSHAFVIVMENKEYRQVIGSRAAPYATALARRYAVATRSYGIRHPSLPNYLALTSGSTLGVHSNCTGCDQSAESIVDQLEAAGLSWRAYMPGMPRACFRGATHGRYAKKHDPFMYYRSVTGDPSRCAKVVPGRRLRADLRRDRLPAYSFLSPDLCRDSHDCSIARGDRYLARVVPRILRALGPRGFLVLTYDEGGSDAGCCDGLARGGRIPTVIAGPGVRRGGRLRARVTHYSTLRTIEDALRLPRLGHAGDADTRPLDAAFERPPRLR